MRASGVIGISAAAHGLVFAGLARVALPHIAMSPPANAASPFAIAVTVEPRPTTRPSEPIAVIVLDEPEPDLGQKKGTVPFPSHTKLVSDTKYRDTHQGSSAIAVSESGVGPQLPGSNEIGVGPQLPGHPSQGSEGSGLMRMRTSPVLTLGEETAGKIPGTPYVAPAEPKVSGKLQSLPGGRAIVNDEVATFDVGKDGTVKITDKPDIDIHLKLPIPDLNLEDMRKDLGEDLTEWLKDPYAGTKFGRMADVSRVWKAVPGACDSWGDVWCDDELAPKSEKYEREQAKTNGSLIGGKADITAYLMRKLGVGDPYASRKLKLLADTRDERVAMGQRYRNEQLEKSAEIVEKTLEELWAREGDPARRRQALFELWDDCEEGPGARGEAGQRARAMVLGWIGAHLPKGSPGAYSDEEIRRLDAGRSSKQAFTPY